MSHGIENFDENYNWVRAKALQRFNISKRPWSNGKNIGLSEGETYILPRDGEGMHFYFDNSGFLEVVDDSPLEEKEKQEEVEDEVFDCPGCDKSFDSERGRDQHVRMTHEKQDDDEDGENSDE